MKIIGILLTIGVICSSASIQNEEFSVRNLYSKDRMPSTDIMVMTKRGEIKKLDDILMWEVDYVLSKLSIKPGNYSISLTRKSNNFYEDQQQNILVETIGCYEYGYYMEAILKVSSVVAP